MNAQTEHQRYESYVQMLRDEGVGLATYRCPSCDKELHSRIPEAGREYSTVFNCPGCGGLHFRVVDSDARVWLRQQPGEQLREVTA